MKHNRARFRLMPIKIFFTTYARALALWCGILLAFSAAASERVGNDKLAGADWSQFRGPRGDGIAAATNVPVEWNATNNVAWRAEIPGNGWSSPVLAGGRLYLTTAVSGEALSLRALCLDAGSGKIIWNVEVFQPDAAAAKAHHQKNGLASPTPVVRGQRVYVHFGHLGTAALDLSGNILWRQTDLKYSPVHGNGGSPALIDDLLVFSCDGGDEPFLVALDRDTGSVRWKTPRQTAAKRTFSFSTPIEITVGGARQLISAGSGFVGSYDLKEGHELWRFGYGEGYSVVPRPIFAHGLLFITSGFDHPALFALDPRGFSGEVAETNAVWQSAKGIPNTPSLLVVGDELYFVSDAGIASCLDARTGKVHWSERLGGNFSSSPIFAAGRVYFQNEAGVGFVVKAGTVFELLAKNELGERTLASYAVTDGALFIRSEGNLRRIGH